MITLESGHGAHEGWVDNLIYTFQIQCKIHQGSRDNLTTHTVFKDLQCPVCHIFKCKPVSSTDRTLNIVPMPFTHATCKTLAL